jgi:iron-sulfur cluster repair protein YtfE (RIC family)
MTDTQVTAVIETRLVHNLHRQASTLLAEAAARPEAPAAALAELRDFLVNQLVHHHESEDDLLWPMIIAAAPELSGPLDGLSGEHEKLDAALDAVAAAPVDAPDRAGLAGAAVALRDLLHEHLSHEEPLLFPALRDHVTEEQWKGFSEHVIATTPNVGPDLLVAFLEEAGTREEVEVVLGVMPAVGRTALRAQGQGIIRVLAG